jgi:hypothetical protein
MSIVGNIAGTTHLHQGERVRIDIAWQDDRTLRGVVVPIAPGVHDLTPFTVTG